jgi:Na+-driven multidrug efflux pump
MKIQNVIDTSKTSLVISFVVLFITFFIAKYLLETYDDQEDKRSIYLTILYSFLIAIFFCFLSLFLFKQISKLTNQNKILHGTFPSIS